MDLSPAFERLYAPLGRSSIPPERLVRALLLQAFYSVRSERQLMERLGYNLLFRWFVGLGIDDSAWDVPSCGGEGWRDGEPVSSRGAGHPASCRAPASAAS